MVCSTKKGQGFEESPGNKNEFIQSRQCWGCVLFPGVGTGSGCGRRRQKQRKDTRIDLVLTATDIKNQLQLVHKNAPAEVITDPWLHRQKQRQIVAGTRGVRVLCSCFCSAFKNDWTSAWSAQRPQNYHARKARHYGIRGSVFRQFSFIGRLADMKEPGSSLSSTSCNTSGLRIKNLFFFDSWLLSFCRSFAHLQLLSII